MESLTMRWENISELVNWENSIDIVTLTVI